MAVNTDLGCIGYSRDPMMTDSAIPTYFDICSMGVLSVQSNDIPPFSLSAEFESKELTITLENGLRYIFSSADLDNVTQMTPGKYSVDEVADGGRSFDLNINNTRLNQALFPVIAEINSTLANVKHIIKRVDQATPKREVVKKFLHGLRSSSSRPDHPPKLRRFTHQS
jgi:hypothetical protein